MFSKFKNNNSDNSSEFLGDIYHKDYSMWCSIAYNIVHDYEVAHDMVADSFIKLLKKKEFLSEMNCYKLKSYIVFTIRNTCYDYLRKSKNAPVLSLDEENMEDIPDNYSLENEVANKADWEKVLAVLKTLSDSEQNIIVKTYFDRMSDKEIAKETGIKYQNISTYRGRILKKIRKLCEKRK